MAGTPQQVTGEADQSSSSLELDELFELEFELELLLEFDELLEFEFELELLLEFDELFELEFELLLLFEFELLLLFEFFFFFLRSLSRRSSSSPRWLRLTNRTSSARSARSRSPPPAFQGKLARNCAKAARSGSLPRDPSSAPATPVRAVVATSARARTDLTAFIVRFPFQVTLQPVAAFRKRATAPAIPRCGFFSAGQSRHRERLNLRAGSNGLCCFCGGRSH